MKEPVPSYETAALREFGEALRARRTIELFLQTPVPEKIVRDAVDVAMWAPNHHVTQPWRFYHLGANSIAACIELLREIVTAKKDAKTADFKATSWSQKPGWMVVTCRNCDEELLQREDYAACAAAVQNFMLYLWKAGIGTKWSSGSITRDPRFFDVLGIDFHKECIVGLIFYGYPKLTPTQQRADIDEILTELP